MIFPVKRLIIENSGYKRDISLKTIYINSSKIVSITDYDGVTDFLLREDSEFQKESFSLIKISDITDDIIVLGCAEQIYSTIKKDHVGKKILND